MQNRLKEIKQNKTEIDIIGWNGSTVAILHDVVPVYKQVRK